MNKFVDTNHQTVPTEQVLDTARYLYKAGHLIGSKRFLRWVHQWDSRFAWAGTRLHERLIGDMLFQVRQAFTVAEARNLGPQKLLQGLAEQCWEVANSYETSLDAAMRKKDRCFTVPRGKSEATEVLRFLSRSPTKGLFKDRKAHFYLWNALEAIELYARARDTLKNDTGHLGFERFLRTLSEDYLLEGYPKDILAHDAHAIRGNEPVKAILVRTGYCSTWLVRSGDDVGPIEGFQTLELSQAA
mgnify:CR=1 FL=1